MQRYKSPWNKKDRYKIIVELTFIKISIERNPFFSELHSWRVKVSFPTISVVFLLIFIHSFRYKNVCKYTQIITYQSPSFHSFIEEVLSYIVIPSRSIVCFVFYFSSNQNLGISCLGHKSFPEPEVWCSYSTKYSWLKENGRKTVLWGLRFEMWKTVKLYWVLVVWSLMMWIFCFRNHYLIPISPWDRMCRSRLACADCCWPIMCTEPNANLQYLHFDKECVRVNI